MFRHWTILDSALHLCKWTTDTQKSATYLDIHLEIDNGGRLKTNFYDKRDDFTFPIVNFPFVSSNSPESQACGVYISRLKRDSMACNQYSDFLDKAQLLSQTLLKATLLLSCSHRYK